VPLRELAQGNASTALATPQQVQKLFSSVETILNFNRQFLARLQKRRAEWPINSKLGKFPLLFLE